MTAGGGGVFAPGEGVGGSGLAGAPPPPSGREERKKTSSPPLDQAKRDKRPVVLATRLPDGDQRLLPDPAAPAELNAAAERRANRTKAAR